MGRIEISKQEEATAVIAVLLSNGYRVACGKFKPNPKTNARKVYIEYEKEQASGGR